MNLKQIFREIKWAYQRVYRGWDDRATWGIGYWLSDKVPDILRHMKGSKVCVPARFFEDDEIDNPDEHIDAASTRYDWTINEIAEGFDILRENANGFWFDEGDTYENNINRCHEKEKIGMEKASLLFEYFWDIGD